MKSKLVNNTKLKLRKNSPEILVVTGIVGVVVSTVMACRATRKANDILDEHVDKMEEVNYSEADAEKAGEVYDRKKETTKVYIHTGTNLVKTYAPSAILGTLSVGCILKSHRILKSRNVALAAAYNTIDKAYKKYRERVIEELGEAADRRFRLGMQEETVEVVEKDEKGKEKKVKKTVEVVPADFDGTCSPYARIFDEFSKKWDDDPEYNKMFLISTQNYANDYLKAHGFLFLNQVYEWLGFPRTQAGQLAGWVYDPKGGEGDNFVDFGIRQIYKRAAAGSVSDKMWVNDLEPSTLLDFNIDGDIMEKAFEADV